MKLIADEHVDRAIVEWLRQTGHDVVWLAEVHRGEPDARLIELADEGNRIIVTKDLDFGELVHAQRLPAPGVLLLRFADLPTRDHLGLLQRIWPLVQNRLAGHFVVATSRQVRFRPLPTTE